MTQYTLLFTDANGKNSVFSITGSKEAIIEGFNKQLGPLKTTHGEKNVKVVEGSDCFLVSIQTIVVGWVYNSVQTTPYGTFYIVPVVNRLEEQPASTVVQTVTKTPVAQDVRQKMLNELSAQLEARKQRAIPFAPPMPKTRVVFHPSHPVHRELMERMHSRRQQIEGY